VVDVFPDRIRDADEAEELDEPAADLAVRLLDDEFEAALSFCCCCPELAELTLLASPDLLAVPALVLAALPPPPPQAVEVLAMLLMLVDDAVLLGIDDFCPDSSP